MTSLTNEDLPDPETPEITFRRPIGISTSTFLRLFSLAPLIWIAPWSCLRLFSGKSILRAPFRYCPVIESLLFATSSGVPAATTSPPYSPAPGPISIK